MKCVHLILIFIVISCSCKNNKEIEKVAIINEVNSFFEKQKIIVDFDGDNILDSIFLEEKGIISVYPEHSKLDVYIDSVIRKTEWIDTIYLSYDSIIFYTTYYDNGDVKNYDSIKNIQFPILNIYSKEEGLGGGVINWNGNEYIWYPKTD